MRTILAAVILAGCTAQAATPPDPALPDMVAKLNVQVSMLEKDVDRLRVESDRLRVELSHKNAIDLCTISMVTSAQAADRAHNRCAAVWEK